MASQTRTINISAWRKLARGFGKLSAWTMLLTGLYFLACLFGSMIGVNAQWREPAQGVRIFVETNGIHTAIIVPKRTRVYDWSAFLPASHLPDPAYAGEYLSFSWGHRQFYLETETWSDIKAAAIGSALIGSDQTLVHIYHQSLPQEGDIARGVTITEAQYAELVDLLNAKFAFNADGTRPPPIAGYGKSDVFYEAKGRYTLVNTCNTWTGDTLSAIGIRMGAWTPMAGGVMRWFPAPANVEN